MEFKLRNFTIEAFNRDVNLSGDLLAKYRRWDGYRKRISALIGEAFQYHPRTNRALALGAGNLNDLDLHFLCEKLEGLDLSDADQTAMENGLKRQRLSDGERGKIRLLRTDYTGSVGKNLFAELENLVKRSASAVEMADFIRSAFRAMAGTMAGAVAGRYPLVISCPVYTQLLYTQIEVFLRILFEAGLYAYGELNEILNAAYGAMPEVLAGYNDLVLGACEDGGLIVLLADVIEMPKGSPVYRQVKRAEGAGVLDAETAEALAGRHGAELSQAGRRDFASKTETVRELYTVWPFDESKEYLVYGRLSLKRA